MGRTLTEASIVVRLVDGIQKCESQKKELLDYVQYIKEKCLNNEITYEQYEALLAKKRDGKTIQEWIEHHDSYIEECKKRVKRKKRKRKTKKVFTALLTLAITIILISVIPK